MIVKTKANQLGSFSTPHQAIEVVDSFEKLLVEHPEESVVLPGIIDSQVLLNSSLVTDTYDQKIDKVAIAASSAGALLSNQYDRYTRAGLLSASFGTFGIAPFGVAGDAYGVSGAGMDFNARIGLALPTAKFKKFLDMEQTLYDNMGMVSARSINLAATGGTEITRAQRITYFAQFNSILGFYQAMLNSIVREYSYLKYVGPSVGMRNYSAARINDEAIQRKLGEIIINIKDLPVLDPEFHDRINTLSKYYFTRKKTMRTPAVHKPRILIGTTAAATVIATGANVILADGGDAWWKTTFATSVIGAGGAFEYDRVANPHIISDYLFYHTPWANADTTVEALLEEMVKHTASLRSIYFHYMQYVRFAMSKGWIETKTLGEYLNWDIDAEMNISPKDMPVTYGHHIKVLFDYLPQAQSVEGTANNAWARQWAPILLAETTGVVSSLSSLGDTFAIVDNVKLGSDSLHLSELASWATWSMTYDASTVSAVTIEAGSAFANPFDGLMYSQIKGYTEISAAGVITHAALSDNPFVYYQEDNTRENELPLYSVFNGAIQFSFSVDIYQDADQEHILAADAWLTILRFMHDMNLDVMSWASENTVGELHFYLTFLAPDKERVLVQIDRLELVRATPQYFNSKLYEINKVSNVRNK